jgi:hypothetical protein
MGGATRADTAPIEVSTEEITVDSNESFWEGLLLDDDARQRRAIGRLDDSITDAMQMQAMSAESLGRQIRELYALDRAQGRELAALRAVIRTLGQMLVELGMDESVVRYRLEAAIEMANAEADEQEEAGRKVQCANCGQQVPIHHTQITETGTVCDRCAV